MNSRHPLPSARGFTLIELSLVLVIAGILLSVAVWQMNSFITGNRSTAAARDLLVRLRSAGAVAARANEPMEIAFINSGSGCVPRYEIRDLDGNVNESVCIANDYPGVTLPTNVLAGSAMQCADEAMPLPTCSLCTGEKVITLFPSGEVETSGVGSGTNLAGDSVVFAPAADGALPRTVAVGIRNLSGRTRIYRPNSAGSAWSCP